MHLTENSKVSLGLIISIIVLLTGAASGGISYVVSGAVSTATTATKFEAFERDMSISRSDVKTLTDEMKKTREDIGRLSGILEQMNRERR